MVVTTSLTMFQIVNLTSITFWTALVRELLLFRFVTVLVRWTMQDLFIVILCLYSSETFKMDDATPHGALSRLIELNFTSLKYASVAESAASLLSAALLALPIILTVRLQWRDPDISPWTYSPGHFHRPDNSPPSLHGVGHFPHHHAPTAVRVRNMG